MLKSYYPSENRVYFPNTKCFGMRSDGVNRDPPADHYSFQLVNGHEELVFTDHRNKNNEGGLKHRKVKHIS